VTEAERDRLRAATGAVFAVDETAMHDGPGLRMLVYLKGCPLRCVWCHSPESQRSEPEIVYYANLCLGCGACVEACPEGLQGSKPPAGAVCRLCGACVEACCVGALEFKGETVRAGDLLDRAVRPRAFPATSGGGVTLSGGEPTAQPEFALALLALLRDAGVHTAVETCGVAPWETLRRFVAGTNLFLYDLKHADSAEHERLTGAANGLVLENLGRLVESGAEVIARVPCIPGLNDSPESIRAIARAARDLGCGRMSLLPYNPATPGKYSWLRREFTLGDLVPQDADTMRGLEALARDEGLDMLPQ